MWFGSTGDNGVMEFLQPLTFLVLGYALYMY